ncbi:hypothetical protein FDU21_20855 [Xanthomonas oryzae pv. oryzae]|nr:hypothetical protein FDU21_20855 [Xanthomonas oryzae pv. oryzae]
MNKKMIGAADLQRNDPVRTSVIDLGPTQQQRDTRQGNRVIFHSASSRIFFSKSSHVPAHSARRVRIS